MSAARRAALERIARRARPRSGVALLLVAAGLVSVGPSLKVAAASPGTARLLVASARCPASPVALGRAGRATELVTVRARSLASTTAVVSLWDRRGDCFVRAGGPWPAEIGRNGLSGHHEEGDGTTPTGAFGVGPVMYGVEADPGVAYRYHRLVCGDWWDEEPGTAGYNRFAHVPCGTAPPFGGASEALWTEAPAYDAFAVIEYNTDPVVQGRGSAIFLHRSTGAPTDGCVALPPAALLTTLRWLRPPDHPLVVIGATAR